MRKTRTKNLNRIKATKPPLQKPGFVVETIEDLGNFCCGVVGLTGATIALSIAIGGFLICGAISRAIDEITDRIPFSHKRT